MVDDSCLPPLSTRPSYASLLTLLKSIELQPSTWTGNEASKEQDINKTREVNAWLPTIFRSDMRWFHAQKDVDGNEVSADDQRDEIMNLTAKRLSERCGRSATSDITRTWIVPQSLVPRHSSDMHIQIHEPGLTEGNTGHKTWGTAFALIKQLAVLGQDSRFFYEIFHPEVSEIRNSTERTSDTCVLELGSGTGLLGIAAAAIWSCRVVLTDLEFIVPNLRRNIEHNLPLIRDRGGDMVLETLNWADHPSGISSELYLRTFPIILASDCVYDTEQVEILANTVDKFLDNSAAARALIALPLRDQFSKRLFAKLEIAMIDRELVLLQRELLEARDDFGDGQGEFTIQRDLYGRKKMQVVETHAI